MSVDDSHLVVEFELARMMGLVDVRFVLVCTLNVLAIPDSVPSADKEIKGVVVTNDRRRLRIDSLLHFQNRASLCPSLEVIRGREPHVVHATYDQMINVIPDENLRIAPLGAPRKFPWGFQLRRSFDTAYRMGVGPYTM